MKRRILIASGIFAPDIGGPASYARSLAVRLADQGVQVSILAYSSVAGHPGDRQLPFGVHRVWTRIPWGLRHAVFFLRAWLLARRSDGVLLLNAASAGVPATVAARLSGKPTM